VDNSRLISDSQFLGYGPLAVLFEQGARIVAARFVARGLSRVCTKIVGLIDFCTHPRSVNSRSVLGIGDGLCRGTCVLAKAVVSMVSKSTGGQL
jgi:hypothetical protein